MRGVRCSRERSAYDCSDLSDQKDSLKTRCRSMRIEFHANGLTAPDSDIKEASMTGAVRGGSRCQFQDETNDVTNCNGTAHCVDAQNELHTDLTFCLSTPEGLTEMISKDLASRPNLCKAKALPGVDSASAISILTGWPVESVEMTVAGASCGFVA